MIGSNKLLQVISGLKMLTLSVKNRHSYNTRTRFFFGGLFLITVTVFTIFVSVIYNKAIATKTTVGDAYCVSILISVLQTLQY